MRVFSESITPRVRYAVQLIFRDVLGAEAVQITDQWNDFEAYAGPKLIYGRAKLEGVPSVYNVDLLFEKDIYEQEINVNRGESGIPYFFQTSAQSAMPFDPFAAAFYLVSRYEEYLPHISDQHDRFPAEASLAFQNNFLQIPVVNHWGNALKAVLLAHDSEWDLPGFQYKFTSTIDVDNLYAYKGKGGFRTIGGFAKDFINFDFSNALRRARSILGWMKDPYETFDLQRSLAQKYGVPAMYFMLFSEFGEFDRSVPMYSRRMHEAVRSLNDFYPVGIHPSYASNQSHKTLKKEIDGLEEALRMPVKRSRQHFLKIQMPHTFRALVDFGIEEDYTMGYAEQLGFRAGICTPFSFYDLEMEVELKLRMYPFAMMDGTLLYYQNIPSEEVLDRFKPIVDAVRAVDGHLISVWHNRIFSEDSPEWKGWNAIYEELLQYAKP